MGEKSTFYTYHADGQSFASELATKIRKIYFPLCGTDSTKIKSCVTPFLSGDIKIDKDRYLTKPASREDLLLDLRNFFVKVKDQGMYSCTNNSEQSHAQVEMGPLWHKLIKQHSNVGLTFEVQNFVPVSGQNVEIIHIKCSNTSQNSLNITPTFTMPIFGRGLANKHDHEHVTALLHNIEQVEHGVVVQPRMSFNEEGHGRNETTYFVLGIEDNGSAPLGSFPTVESFYGEAGYEEEPIVIKENSFPEQLSADDLQGKEAMGAIRFQGLELAAGETKEYFIVVGVADERQDVESIFAEFKTNEQIANALAENKSYWANVMNSIVLNKGDAQFNSWMPWVTLQPVLRRIYGCSFLPDHDYGKGGKGWRDIWQDLLSLILIEPQQVRETLVHNFAGVRIDGSNATIIGSEPGEFLADRNAITRVWMDHGAWPFRTLLLYVDQTGDFDILLEQVPYFKDPQMSRTFERDESWNPQEGQQLKNEEGQSYQGSVLEHILVQNLVQFFNVGEHNCTRLEHADWNDGLDMAFQRGESVTFMSYYGGNLNALADLLEALAKHKNISSISLFEEVTALLNVQDIFDDKEAKKKLLFESYFKSVQPRVSGQQVEISIEDLAKDLRAKSQWIFEHIRKQEKITVGSDEWFNGYYDNNGQRVEGEIDGNVRMTLTGQVFPIMSGLADDDDIKKVVNAANNYLRDKTLGGYRLNTDFKVKHYLTLGRAFGFAFGTKENGAFFSHMIVMYAYALYSRGFAKEGYEVLNSIYQMSIDTEKSKIYPGVPEYFDSLGRGMYHFLTGSASWFVLTQLTQVFGVRGRYGDLVLDPKLVLEEFGSSNEASVRCQFAGKLLNVTYVNSEQLDCDQYVIKSVELNNNQIDCEHLDKNGVCIKRTKIEEGPEECNLRVILGR